MNTKTLLPAGYWAPSENSLTLRQGSIFFMTTFEKPFIGLCGLRNSGGGQSPSIFFVLQKNHGHFLGERTR